MFETVTCPQCGGEASGMRPGLPVVTCGNCHALLTVSAGELEAVGDAGRIPFDVSPLQIGARLVINGQRGEIVGRERWSFDRGFWNEWLLQFPTGDAAWVAEEAGLYMVMVEITPDAEAVERLKRVDLADNKALGEQVEIAGDRYTVSDIKRVRCVASEGALIHIIPAKFVRESIDLRGDGGKALTWQSDANGYSVWQGRYYRLEELDPAGLRRFEGWARPAFEATG